MAKKAAAVYTDEHVELLLKRNQEEVRRAHAEYHDNCIQCPIFLACKAIDAIIVREKI